MVGRNNPSRNPTGCDGSNSTGVLAYAYGTRGEYDPWHPTVALWPLPGNPSRAIFFCRHRLPLGSIWNWDRVRFGSEGSYLFCRYRLPLGSIWNWDRVRFGTSRADDACKVRTLEVEKCRYARLTLRTDGCSLLRKRPLLRPSPCLHFPARLTDRVVERSSSFMTIVHPMSRAL